MSLDTTFKKFEDSSAAHDWLNELEDEVHAKCKVEKIGGSFYIFLYVDFSYIMQSFTRPQILCVDSVFRDFILVPQTT